MGLKNYKDIVIVVLIILIILGVGFIVINILNFENNDMPNVNSTNTQKDNSIAIAINESYPDGPTSEAKIDSSNVNSKLIGENNIGTVEILGPFGNTSSNIRIAYLIGMHPLESKAHKALFDTIISKNDSLRYCYYIYKINVSSIDDNSEGRMNGQLLAQEFLAPEVVSKDYDLVVDVHSNKGTRGGTYSETNFIFAVGQDEKSNKVVYALLEKLPNLTYYFPEQQSSPPYITLPIERNGTPTINYETYCYEPLNTTYSLMNDFVEEVDRLEF